MVLDSSHKSSRLMWVYLDLCLRQVQSTHPPHKSGPISREIQLNSSPSARRSERRGTRLPAGRHFTQSMMGRPFRLDSRRGASPPCSRAAAADGPAMQPERAPRALQRSVSAWTAPTVVARSTSCREFHRVLVRFWFRCSVLCVVFFSRLFAEVSTAEWGIFCWKIRSVNLVNYVNLANYFGK